MSMKPLITASLGCSLMLIPLFACQTATANTDGTAEVEGPTEPEWVSIFNGEDLTGWTPKITGYAYGDNYGDTFRVEDGVLKVVYDPEFYPRFQNEEGVARFGHLFYETSYSHYRFRMEYRFVGEQTAGGPGWAFRNSGIMFHGQPGDTMGLNQDFPVSIELQLLGGSGSGERTTGNLCTPGTNVDWDGAFRTNHVINSESDTFHGDQWVAVEYEVIGSERVRHYINGELVMEYGPLHLDADGRNVNDKTWLEAAVAAHPDLRLNGGSISLQSESHPIEFRNIEIMNLEGFDIEEEAGEQENES